jgi:acetoin utilization protein AcuB
MSKDLITVPFDYTMEETAEILLENKISGVPVVDNKGKIVGMITETDLFRAMMSLTGLKSRGILFAFQLEDRSGSIKEVADIIREYGGRIASILSSYDRVQKGYRKAYIRMYGIDRLKLPQLKEELKEKKTLLYMVDLRENKREIYSF